MTENWLWYFIFNTNEKKYLSYDRHGQDELFLSDNITDPFVLRFDSYNEADKFNYADTVIITMSYHKYKEIKIKMNNEQHFKDLYEAAIEVIADLLLEIDVFDGATLENNRREKAKKMIKEWNKKGYCS